MRSINPTRFSSKLIRRLLEDLSESVKPPNPTLFAMFKINELRNKKQGLILKLTTFRVIQKV